ncbi:hypothetical protein ACOSZF_02115 [Cytobacillus firmus]|uniref:hypothetical protein n=1 Tax=Cytobacillus firmus TaxID=1399 RepID=UPI00077C14B1|nr:hypothetical protein [Cytobacillus firmus]MBG9543003.1 hypothetical protein [Cytobacillus firmus]MBG9552877.1 hypothetical protein [Cytobacillus firmus]MBG9556996.1 hypothetical protein [Cytobacillus firmus]MBG9576459.1 hypothetical protein [Cytobacillus firmus]MBG9657013.1 hypothetical protein [Cytobacillus firmus]
MFDPTAFENMKVVMEGGFYDRDLSGEIRIVDRNDIINTAKMCRRYDITFTDLAEGMAEILCTFIMEAGLDNLAAELLPQGKSKILAGCRISVNFTIKHQHDHKKFQEIREVLRLRWGSGRNIEQTVKYSTENRQGLAETETIISFNRLVQEEQIDDLNEMIAYMTASMDALRKIQF